MQTIFNERMDTKKLRQKILDLAIHGKLVPQDPNDEPASVLLERIRIEKERLIAEGKIKRSKKSATSDTSHYENVPFEVPEGWCWCTLDDLAFYKKGPFGSSLTKSMFVPDSPLAYKVYEQKNAIQKDHTLGSYYIDENKYKELSGFKVEPNDIIVSCAGTIGETYVMPYDIRKGIINQALMLIRLHLKDIQDFYLLYFDFILKAEAAKESKGTAIKNIPPFDVLKSFFIPIPPLAEQGRILEEINKLMSFVDSIEVSTKDISSLITSAKSKILDLAIHGKLVPQDPNDEPAIELLKRINPKFVPCDNAHYENVPSNWALARVEDIGQLLSGRDLTKDECNSENIGLPYLIGASNIEGNTFSFIRWTEKPQVISQIGDILISCKGTIGAIVKNDIGDIHIARQFMAIRPNTDGITSDYLHICMIAVVEEIKKDARGVIPGIARDDILTKVFAIPPINEQRRIIAAINQYHSILDNISANL